VGVESPQRPMKRRAPETACPDAEKEAARPRTGGCAVSSEAPSGLSTIGGPSWSVDARVGDEGRHGRPLCVEWASPRPMLEVKVGLGILEDESLGGPTSFECVAQSPGARLWGFLFASPARARWARVAAAGSDHLTCSGCRTAAVHAA
jgi:hypothetical protein